ncbi:phosphohydrolase [Lujinxingia litoralis]|uniref:Phosphohydrolase n=1 Tax=Lujinxingia litoralis TaxID=2211119 RepID=A0A328CA80_9DELT|nr:HD domain-containing protein [Lujinxingia litoralis]RAL24664.1 phosphohydrolase [Lujinxingia litoralis]
MSEQEAPVLMSLSEAACAHAEGAMAATAGHDVAHLRRVHRVALRLWEVEGGDREVVEVGAWLHDLVNLPKDHPERRRASTLSAEAAVTWVGERMSPAQRALLFEAIQRHSYSAGYVPESLEAKIVCDADRLDALGAVGLMRTLETGGALGRLSFDPRDPFCQEREPDDGVFTLDHVFAKLFKLPGLLHTEAARTIAAERIEVMEHFLSALGRELGHPYRR